MKFSVYAFFFIKNGVNHSKVGHFLRKTESSNKARCKTFRTPGCTDRIHPGLQAVYMGVCKVCTSGWRREWLTCKINRISRLIEILYVKDLISVVL